MFHAKKTLACFKPATQCLRVYKTTRQARVLVFGKAMTLCSWEPTQQAAVVVIVAAGEEYALVARGGGGVCIHKGKRHVED